MFDLWRVIWNISKHITKSHGLTLESYLLTSGICHEVPKYKYCGDNCRITTRPSFDNLRFLDYCTKCSGIHKRKLQSKYYENHPDKLIDKNKNISKALLRRDSNGNTIGHNNVIAQIRTLKSLGNIAIFRSQKS